MMSARRSEILRMARFCGRLWWNAHELVSIEREGTAQQTMQDPESMRPVHRVISLSFNAPTKWGYPEPCNWTASRARSRNHSTHELCCIHIHEGGREAGQ
jgi:hypothetical protein